MQLGLSAKIAAWARIFRLASPIDPLTGYKNSPLWGIVKSALRLRPVNAHFPKLFRPFGEAAPALIAFFRRRRGINHFVDRLGGELLSAQPPAAGLGNRLPCRLRLEPELDQAPDGFGAGDAIRGGPLLDLINKGLRQARADKRVFAGCRSTTPLFWVHLN
jgi:hypothetical protein